PSVRWLSALHPQGALLLGRRRAAERAGEADGSARTVSGRDGHRSRLTVMAGVLPGAGRAHLQGMTNTQESVFRAAVAANVPVFMKGLSGYGKSAFIRDYYVSSMSHYDTMCMPHYDTYAA